MVKNFYFYLFLFICVTFFFRFLSNAYLIYQINQFFLFFSFLQAPGQQVDSDSEGGGGDHVRPGPRREGNPMEQLPAPDRLAGQVGIVLVIFRFFISLFKVCSTIKIICNQSFLVSNFYVA